jgi:hypothetical protein
VSITKPAVAAAVGATAIVAILIVGAVMSHGYESILGSDAQHFFRVATDPFGTGDAMSGTGAGGGTAYRYGRILFPLLAWFLALGQPAWIAYTLPIVYLAGIWLVAAVGCEWCREAGQPVPAGLLIFLLPSVFYLMPLLVPEFLITGLLLVCYRFVLHGRIRAAQVTSAFLLLARETAVLALIPLAFTAIRQRRYRDAAGWALALLPLLVWWTWLRARMGVWPCFDPANVANRPLDWPFRGFLAAVWSSPSDAGLLLTAATGWITLAYAVWMQVRFPSLLSAGALSLSLLIIVFGSGQAQLPLEAQRLMIPMQMLLVLAWVTGRGAPRCLVADHPEARSCATPITTTTLGFRNHSR